MIIYYLLLFQNLKNISQILIKRAHNKTAILCRINRPHYANFTLTGS
jgi:hypothetical protein